MVKTIALKCVTKVAKKMSKAAMQDAMQSLKESEQTTPSKSSLAKGLLETTPTKELRGAQPEVKVWPPTYRTLARFPRQVMAKYLLERWPCLSLEKVTFWRMQDKDIVPHLFECMTGLEPGKCWPQGPCHEKGVLELVVDTWLKQGPLTSQAQALSPEVGFADMKALCRTGRNEPDWNAHGQFSLEPEGEQQKTVVLHKATGKRAELPVYLRVDGTWKIEKNWSAVGAKLVDATGHGTREISSFFQDPLYPNCTWAEFASQEAEKFCTQGPTSFRAGSPGLPASLASACTSLRAEWVPQPEEKAPGTPQTMLIEPASPQEDP